MPNYDIFASSGQRSAIFKIINMITNQLLMDTKQIGLSSYLATYFHVKNNIGDKFGILL